ncbi:hypothetical protein ACOMHN_018626 [Nucella lapillus]
MVEITKCDVQTVLNLKTRLSQIYKVIDTYRWIIEAYVSDFYVKDHWSRLPPSWQEFLDQVDFPALSCLLTGQPWSNATTGSSVSPLSLLALKAFVERNALNRRFVDLDSTQVTAAVAHTLVKEDSSSASPEKTQVNTSTSSVVCNQADKTLRFRNGQLMEMEHIFRKHVKPKKQHEIRQLGKVIGVVTEASASDHIVDVGAGLGHLSRLLTFAHGLKVTTVEAAGGHAPKATEFDRELKKDIQKKLKRKEPSEEQEQETLTTPADLPNHVVCRVEPDISTEDFLALVLHGDSGTHSSAEGTVSPSSGNATDSAQNWGSGNALFMDCKDISQTERVSGLRELHKKTSAGTELKENIKQNDCDEKKEGFAGDDGSGGGGGKERKRLLLAGLHACGDLTATLFRVFVNCPAVSALVSVGCCYMKLSAYSEVDEAHCERGYPLSQYVRSLLAHPLTYEAREMACHFADAYAQRLLDNPPHLKIHSYRAAVQYVVTSVRPDFVPGATRLIVKKGAEIPFPQYASQCLRRLGMDAAEVADDVMTTAESMTTDWRRVVAFYTLRLSLAPLVETALLLDRMLFLYEHGMTSVAVPVFDSKLSPRNFALLACKPRSS